MEFAWGFLAGMVALGVVVIVTAARRASQEEEGARAPRLPQHRDLVLMPQEVARLVRGFEVVVQQDAGSIGVRCHLSVGGLRGVEAIVAMARKSEARGTGEPDGELIVARARALSMASTLEHWTSLEPVTEAMAQCPDCRELKRPCEVHSEVFKGIEPRDRGYGQGVRQ